MGRQPVTWDMACRIVRGDISEGSPDTWEDVLPESTDMLEGALAVKVCKANTLMIMRYKANILLYKAKIGKPGQYIFTSLTWSRCTRSLLTGDKRLYYYS